MTIFEMMIRTFLIVMAMGCPAWAAPRIESVDDLRKVEEALLMVTAKATPATVLIQSELSRFGRSSGSGVVVSEEGLVLTAAHVVDGQQVVALVFPDGTETKGKVLGLNYTRDSAMVQITEEGKKWPHVKLGEESDLDVGDFVVAMGHPKGYDPTRRPPVRFGRVVTKKRGGFLTTDCTLTGGDSGGPLFNLKGEVVGIHSNIAPDEKAINNHAGIDGFKRDWLKLESGKSWGQLGAEEMREIDRAVMGVRLEMVEDKGLTIREMYRGSPAHRAGLQVGDVIVAYDGLGIDSMKAYNEASADYVAGDVVELKIVRGEAEIVKKVRLIRLGAFGFRR